MSQMDDLRRAMRKDPAPSRRALRAARTRAEALSPWRLAMRLAGLPLVVVSVTVSIYVSTSEFDPPEALMHLVARAGCPAAASVGLAPSRRGELGYHARNDPDGDGVACEAQVPDNGIDPPPLAITARDMPQSAPDNPNGRAISGAKFLRPKTNP